MDLKKAFAHVVQSIGKARLQSAGSRAVDRSLQAGFSLIELLVVTAILVLISGMLLASNSRFGGIVQLESLAFDIGLSIRQAQVYGISVRQFSPGVYTAGYGMRFDLASPSTYVLFGDAISANGIYDTGELVASTVITSGYQIADLCVTQTGEAEDCSVTRVDVLFKRPEPDAYIAAGTSGGEPSCVLSEGTCYESAKIVVASPRGDIMNVIISVNGQVSVTKF